MFGVQAPAAGVEINLFTSTLVWNALILAFVITQTDKSRFVLDEGVG